MIIVTGAVTGGCTWMSGKPPVLTSRLDAAVKAATAGESYLQSMLYASEPLSPKELAEADSYIQCHPDFTSYHLLLALRQQSPLAYGKVPDGVKAKILCQALSRLLCLNDFGYLEPSESYDDVAGRAIIELGAPALPRLVQLLKDKNEAPLCGSQPATLFSAFRYRRADFAYRYIMLILGRRPTFPVDPAERDKLIDELHKEMVSK